MSRKKKKTRRYHDLLTWFELPEINRTYTARYLQATIELSTYKGTVQLRVLRDDEGKACSGIALAGSAWLRGDDLDALIEILRDYKREWLKAYRGALREDRRKIQARSAWQARTRRNRKSR